MPYETEWQTRKKRIDSRLIALGWTIRHFSDKLNLGTLSATAVEELPTRNGPADYGLFVDGRLLGIIEAKKVTVNPQNVLEQAKRYAAGVHLSRQATGTDSGCRSFTPPMAPSSGISTPGRRSESPAPSAISTPRTR